MPYRLLADAALVTHAAFVAFVMLGGLLAWRRPWLAWLHLPVVAWGVGIELTGGICPLTPLENRLRDLAGQAGYDGGFVEHYLIPLLYPAGLLPAHQLWIGVFVIALNVVLYAWAWQRARNRPPRETA